MVKNRSALILVCLLATGLLGPINASAGDSVTCTYDSGTRTAEVIISGPVVSFGIYVDGTEIKVGGADCSPEAFVGEVDSVEVTQTIENHVALTIDVDEPFAPGNEDEEGNSDEIEFSVNLGGDPGDSLTIKSEFDTPLYARAGRFTLFGNTRTVVNINANETDHIDFDVVMVGVDELRFTGSNASDVIGAQGNAGTGEPVTDGIYVRGSDEGDSITGGLGPDDLAGGFPDYCFDCAGNDAIKGMAGRDLLTGGPDGDHLRGGNGKDTIMGLGGHDNLYGQNDNDTVCGHKGQDFIRGGWGNDKLNGGPNPDSCRGGPGKDTLKNCE